MAKTRLVVETTTERKKQLTKTLRKQGLTLTGWLNDRIQEYVPEADTLSSHVKPLESLAKLRNAQNVLVSLKKIDWEFQDANTRYFSHNIHPYPAKFIPQIPAALIRLLSVRGEKVWDPFGGSGTTALEALIAGRQAVSTDVNPVATLVGKAKCLSLTSEETKELKVFLEQLRVVGKSKTSINATLQRHKKVYGKLIPPIPNIEKWFHPSVIDELAFLKWRIAKLKSENAKHFALAAFSKIIVKVSYQDGETRYASKPTKVVSGSTVTIFSSQLQSSLNKLQHYSHLLQYHKPDFFTADLRYDSAIAPNSVDLVITSPPYPNATDYHLYHRFRLYWLGDEPQQLGKKEIGSHLRSQRQKSGIETYLNEMKSCLSSIYSGLRPGRYAALVLGDAMFEGQVHNTATLVTKTSKELGFRHVGTLPRKVHATKRSFIAPARRLRQESIVVLQKPGKEQTFFLGPPPYKLWPYEKELRKKEAKTVLKKSVRSTTRNRLAVKSDGLDADALKRLTFSHTFSAPSFNEEKTWQATIENGDAQILNNRKDPKYVTHGLHAYKGKFYPQLAKTLFNLAGLQRGNKILDPFCGSGTVLLEAYLNGLHATGFDINPIALKIARAKTGILSVDPYTLDASLNLFIEKLLRDPQKKFSTYFAQTHHQELISWFPIPVLDKLAGTLSLISEEPDERIREFLEVCVSSIVRDVSQQEPRDLRIRRRKSQLNDAPVSKLLIRRVEEQRKRLIDFAYRFDKSPTGKGSSHVFDQDVRNIDSRDNRGGVDAIITSPPYATALPYIDTDRLSILVLFGYASSKRSRIENRLIGARDINLQERSSYEELIAKKMFGAITSQTARKTILKVYKKNLSTPAGFRRQNMASLLFRYYEDMSVSFARMKNLVKRGGSVFMVIGDNKTTAGGTEIRIPSSDFLLEAGRNLGLRVVDDIPITVTQENRLHNKNSITSNRILWLKKN